MTDLRADLHSLLRTIDGSARMKARHATTAYTTRRIDNTLGLLQDLLNELVKQVEDVG